MATPKKSKAKVKSNNSTGYHGVTKDKAGNFIAQIYFSGKTHRLYKGKNVIKAAEAYDTKAFEVHGEKAKLNFPTSK
jgi:hypothetical protein